MKSISSIIKNIRNLLPYFLLIAIYFFFVNLEARKENNKEIKSTKQSSMPNKRSEINERNLRIKIPVIPYNQ